MIGSKRKVLNVIRELEKEGLPREAFERIHAPMGLDIGAISPEEIAISVAAEMIAVRRNAASNWRSLSHVGVRRRIAAGRARASERRRTDSGRRRIAPHGFSEGSAAISRRDVSRHAVRPVRRALRARDRGAGRRGGADPRARRAPRHLRDEPRLPAAARPAPCSAVCAPCRRMPKACCSPWWTIRPWRRRPSTRSLAAHRQAAARACRATGAAAAIPSGFRAS